MTEPVLSKEQRVSIEAESHMHYAGTGRDLVKSAIEITEQAVLQSPEIQRLREAAKELADWAEHEVGAEPEITPGLQAIRALIPK